MSHINNLMLFQESSSKVHIHVHLRGKVINMKEVITIQQNLVVAIENGKLHS